MSMASVSESLDFAKAKTNYASHGVHSFSAKFPPQLAAWGINKFTRRGERVLDPMCGSGTTLVEAMLLGRNSFGVDIDPLARLISQVKSTPLDPVRLKIRCDQLFSEFKDSVLRLREARRLRTPYNSLPEIPDFPNRDYWFLPEVSEELVLLKSTIQKMEAEEFRNYFYLVFSSLIITKGKTSVANVRDLAHSRPHFARPATPPDVLATFSQKLWRLSNGIIAFSLACDRQAKAEIIGDDATRLPIASGTVDLVFTSPPYVNAIDYQRAHKFSLFWLGDVLGIPPQNYTELGKSYIGTDRVPLSECKQRLAKPFGLPLIDRLIKDISLSDAKRAGVTHRYFEDMQRVLHESARVVRSGKRAIFVVCPSMIRNVLVPTHEAIVEMGANIKAEDGSKLVCEYLIERTLDDSKRQLPFIRGEFGPGMRTEYVVVLRKES